MDREDPSAGQPAQAGHAPAEFVELPPEPTQWPVALGWILIGYGILGIGTNLCGAVSLHWYAPAVKWAFGVEVPGPPLSLTISTSILSFLGVALGIVLIRGAWRLKVRRASGARLVQRWVALRLALAVVGLAGGLLMLKSSIQWSTDVESALEQAARRRAEQSVSGPPPGMGGGGGRRGRGGGGGGMRMGGGGGGSSPPALEPTPQRGSAYYAMQVGGVALSAASVSIMPLVTGFILTSRRRRDEWSQWSD